MHPDAPQPRPAAPQSTTRVAGSPRILIHKSAPADTSSAATTPTGASPEATNIRREPYTDEQVQAAWQAYIEQHPNEHIMVSNMRMTQPVRESDDIYTFEVGDAGQMDFVENNKQSLLQFLRDAVNNDMLALNVKVGAVRESAHRLLTPREVVDEIKEHSPGFTKFIDDFKLGLA